MSDDPAPAAESPPLVADQFPVTGDPVWIRAEFRALSAAGCHLRIKSPGGSWQLLLVDGAEVLCPLRVGHVLASYGQ